MKDEWSEWDLGRALPLLLSRSPGVVRRTLRKIHIRLWHCPAARMRDLLKVAGAPVHVVDQVQSVVDTCRVCRSWQDVAPRAIGSASMALHFNEEIQFDLLFWQDAIICHLLDKCTRFAAAGIVPNRQTASILDAITRLWFRIFGPPSRITSDHEDALDSDEGRSWATKWGTRLSFKAPGSHAHLIERHNALLRDQLHLIKDQLEIDGTPVPDGSIVDEAALAKNVLTNIKGASPYQAVFGRQMNLLLDFEPASATALDDDPEGIPGISRHVARLRHAAVSSIVQATAQDKISRSLSTKTRQSGERLELKLGESIDFFRDPPNKDISGWRGPAVVTDLSGISDGQVGLKWHGRSMTARLQDVRRSLVLVTSFFQRHQAEPFETQFEVMSNFVESMDPGTILLGMTYSTKDKQWQMTSASRRFPVILEASLHVGRHLLQLDSCIAVRLARQAKALSPIPHAGLSVIYSWHTGRRAEAHWMQHDATKQLDLINELGNDWMKLNIAQFMIAEVDQADDLRRLSLDVDCAIDPHEGHLADPSISTSRSMSASASPTMSTSTAPTSTAPATPRNPEASAPADEDEQDHGEKRARSEHSSGNPSPQHAQRTERTEHYRMDDNDDEEIISDEDFDYLMENEVISYRDKLCSEDHELDLLTAMSSPPDAEFFLSGGLGDFKAYTAEEQVCINLETEDMFREHVLMYLGVDKLEPDTIAVWQVSSSSSSPMAVIEKDLPLLTANEMKEFLPEVNAACLEELREWVRLCHLRRRKRRDSRNIVDMRWVIKWKMIDKKRAVRARLAARGFKDKLKLATETYSGTTSRWGQRSISAAAAMYGYRLWTIDVPKAFLRGLTFQQLSDATGEEELHMQLELPAGTIPLLRKIDGFATFDPMTEVLETDKPVIGSVVAPKAFALKLDQVLREASLQPTEAEPKIYIKHRNGQLVQMVGPHVDDLKGCDPVDGQDHAELLRALEKHFGPIKDKRYGQFECCGVKHHQSDDLKTVTCTQDHYLEQLRPIVHPSLKYLKPDDRVDDTVHAQFMSLRGGVAWVTMCRADGLVYVGHLQRCCDVSKPPSVKDVMDLNVLLKWLKRKKSIIKHVQLTGTPVLKVISDSAFKAADPDCLALRGLIVGLSSANGDEFNAIDFWSRKQTRVCRSTFAAETHNLSEAAEEGMLLAGFWEEVFWGKQSAAVLTSKLESGQFRVQIWLYADAMSVFAAIAAQATKCPTEQQMLYEILALRGHLLAGRVALLLWIDTRDMLADALTKGKIARTALIEALATARWTIVHDEKVKHFPVVRPKRMQQLLYAIAYEKDAAEDVGITNGNAIERQISVNIEHQIFVKTLTGKTISVRTNLNFSITDVKDQIQNLTQIPVSMQRLIYAGKQIEDGRTLKEQGIARESTLHLTSVLNAGMPPPTSGKPSQVKQEAPGPDATRFTLVRIIRIYLEIDPAPEPCSDDWFSVFAVIYGRFNPDQLERLAWLVVKHAGNEKVLLKALAEKYNFETLAAAELKATHMKACMKDLAPIIQARQKKMGTVPGDRSPHDQGLVPSKDDGGSEPPSPTTATTSPTDYERGACRICGIFGHWGNECPSRPVPKSAPGSAVPPWKRKKQG